MEPLLRIIAIEYKTKYRVDFPDGVKYVKYFCENGNQPVLFIETSESPKNSGSSVPFLEIFNERNYAYGNTEKLIAIIQEQKIPDLYKIIYSILKLFPKIRELNLANIDIASDLNCPNWFDRLIYLLLSKNESLMRSLTGFIIYGNYRHTKATIMLLRQYEFQKFGVRLCSYTSECLLLWALFKEETEESIEQYHKNQDIQLGDNYDEHSYEKYNRLRNSVRHFVGTESTIAFVSMHSLIKNIQTATIYLHQSKVYHIRILHHLYPYVFRSSRELVDCHRPEFMYVQFYPEYTREYPFQFEILEVIAGPDLLEELMFDGVEPLASPPSHDFETNIHVYELSKLAIINNELSTRTTCEVSFIDSVACDKGIFKITIISTDMVDINDLYSRFEIVNAANPSSRFKKIVLDLLIENFGYVPVFEKVIKTDTILMSMILITFDKYLDISEETELIIRLSPLSHSGVNIALLRVQFNNFINRYSACKILLRRLKAIERKIIFEQADSVKETCANAL
ncbi:hypothetical protein ENBRE01_0890 [Enteropsectra breve]|nr:hypothetical protein ENBRE01_0890 [Enteropsectra breve]